MQREFATGASKNSQHIAQIQYSVLLLMLLIFFVICPLSFVMNIKLFAIMGGFWIMESISWFAAGLMHEVFWMVFDVFNVLRGLWLLIFCVFLSKRVRTALLRKFFCISGFQATTESNRNTATMSFSKCSQTDSKDQVEMRTLVTIMANDTPARGDDTI